MIANPRRLNPSRVTATQAGPSHGLRGQAPQPPVVYFYAAQVAHFYSAVDRSDWFVPLRRAINHQIYWSDEDARAPSCFSDIAKEAGWMTDVQAFLTRPEVSGDGLRRSQPNGVTKTR